jgi:hypothetical protein
MKYECEKNMLKELEGKLDENLGTPMGWKECYS